jgi:signal transduction histidine kinase
VAELQQARGDADDARRMAETANRAKSEFLAVMSHELRQPLNAIQGYVDLLELELRGPLTDEQRADLARIRKNQRRLLALINDVLAFARVEAGQLEYALVDVPLHVVLDDVVPSITPQLMRKQITFTCDPVDQALAVHADIERVEQILINLLSNAIKFTDTGGMIGVSCDGGEGRVAIHISDTGRGIVPQRLPMIFDPFVQVDRALNSPLEGIGLGLSISRTLARAMGGDVTAESVLGKGSTFTLTLPRA